MNTPRTVIPLLAALLLLALPAAGQEPAAGEGSPTIPTAMMIQAMFAQPRALTHPAQLALQEWEALRLTPEQIRRMRDIEEAMLRPLRESITRRMHDGHPLGFFLPGTPMDEDSLRASFRRSAEEDAAIMIGLHHAVDSVYAALDPGQRRTLRRLQEEEIARVREHELGGGQRAGAALHQPCTAGGSSGGMSLSPRVQLQYVAEYRGDSVELKAVFVGRAADRLHGSRRLPPRPELPGVPQGLAGGTIESWYMQYDERAHVAYVHRQPVTLGEDNVVLVDRVDLLHEPPVVVGTYRVPPLFAGGCPPGTDWVDLLRAHLEQVPEVRAFIGS